jgi:hypothetical protein
MSRSQLLSTLSEREWVQAWESEQEALDRLRSQRGSWLPNVVEVRDWGALRWTSGQPSHAAASGQAVAETYAVLSPRLDERAARRRILDALRERPPVRRFVGCGFREQHVRGAARGAAAGGVVVAAALAVLGAGGLLVIAGAIVGIAGGTTIGTAIVHGQERRERKEVLADADRVRTVTGQYAPVSWTRLVAASTSVAGQLANDDSESAQQTRKAVHGALWEAAGLLLSSSNHTGVEVLAGQMERLAEADRR